MAAQAVKPQGTSVKLPPQPPPDSKKAEAVAQAAAKVITNAPPSPAALGPPETEAFVDFGIDLSQARRRSTGTVTARQPAAKADSPFASPRDQKAAAGAGAGHARKASMQLETLPSFAGKLLLVGGFKPVFIFEGNRQKALADMRNAFQAFQCQTDDGKTPCVVIQVNPLKHPPKSKQQEFFQITETEPAKFKGEFFILDTQGQHPVIKPLFSLDPVNARNKDYLNGEPYLKFLNLFKGSNPDYALKLDKAEIGGAPAAAAAPAAKAAQVTKAFKLDDVATLLLKNAKNSKIVEILKPRGAVLKEVQDVDCTVKCLTDDGKGFCFMVPAESKSAKLQAKNARFFFTLTEPKELLFQGAYCVVDYSAAAPRLSTIYSAPVVNGRNKGFTTNPNHAFQILDKIIFGGEDPFYSLRIGCQVAPKEPSSHLKLYINDMALQRKQAVLATGAAVKLPPLSLKTLLEAHFLKLRERPCAFHQEAATSHALLAAKKIKDNVITLCQGLIENSLVCFVPIRMRKIETVAIGSVGSATFHIEIADDQADDFPTETMYLVFTNKEPGVFEMQVLVIDHASSAPAYELEAFTALNTTNATFQETHIFRQIASIFKGENISYELVI